MVILTELKKSLGSERIVGKRDFKKREAYVARRTRLREYPIPLGSPIKTALFSGRCFSLFSKAFGEFKKAKF